MFDFSSYSSKSKYYDDFKKIVVPKIKDQKDGVSIEKFARVKPKIY